MHAIGWVLLVAAVACRGRTSEQGASSHAPAPPREPAADAGVADADLSPSPRQPVAEPARGSRARRISSIRALLVRYAKDETLRGVEVELTATVFTGPPPAQLSRDGHHVYPYILFDEAGDDAPHLECVAFRELEGIDEGARVRARGKVRGTPDADLKLADVDLDDCEAERVR
jgi:hypothetical protein